ncbi:hypothetical protein B0T17DRAFT_509616 [Bombardia bombarda]|uniref:Uncharacterized protein n=1 Tax=Bombardia bombarda TaxID=252184 RepID=A0AA39WMC1_9PEZI|nr:hypothetical protein B0T17DRAFT_509616 [Bombardia bombarda]
MDILYSPSGIGALSSTAMAEVARRSESLRTTTSFQRMLELEKKYKAASDETHDRSRERAPERARETEDETEAGTPVEPVHKQVKFLAPDEDEEDMSDQSSICQSPSWEGYGMRKKEKKKEAERRKKEKEQAEKEAKAEAKAAKKRFAARLSKAAPPATTHRDSTIAGLTNAERSMSDPMLISKHLAPESRLTSPRQEFERAASTNDLQRARPHRPTTAEIVVDPVYSERRLMGGSKLELETSAMSPSDVQARYPPSLPYHSLRDDSLDQRQYPGSPREAFPPSASRSSTLRYLPGHGRSNSLQQGTANHSQDSQLPTDRGRSRDGYVSRQRALSTERAMAVLSDEQLVGNISLHSSSTRSSSRSAHHRETPLALDAKAVAKKLASQRTTPAVKDNRATKNTKANGQTDYFNFMEHAYSPDAFGALASVGGIPLSLRKQDSARVTPQVEQSHVAAEAASVRGESQKHASLAQERPSTSQSSIGSKDPSSTGSIASSNRKKGRSFKDYLNMSKGSASSTTSTKTAMTPYLKLRSRMSSHSSTRREKDTPLARPESSQTTAAMSSSTSSKVTPEYNSGMVQDVSAQPSSSNSVKTTEAEAHTGSRVSEGSSTSSAYEDGSPLPSPVTTPDTSRPQSSRGIPLTSFECSRASDTSNIPRLSDSETLDKADMLEEDRWSRTALPLDIDCDVGGLDEDFSDATPMPQVQMEVEPLKPRRRETADYQAETQETVVSIPPRSRKRDQGSNRSERMSNQQGLGSQQRQGLGTENSEIMSERGVMHTDITGRGETKAEKAQHRQSNKPRSQEHESHQQSEQTRERNNGHEAGSRQRPAGPSSEPLERGHDHILSSMSSTGTRSQTVTSPESPLLAGFSRNAHMTGSPEPDPIQIPARMPLAPGPPPSASSVASAPPQTRPVLATPVSILKQPTRSMSEPVQTGPATASSRAQVLSALPKHMQLQAGISARPPATGPESRVPPIAKMLVKCCNCEFYHDMPSKIYECMAKPDGIIEDKVLGISGAITTMVKCPWCGHNMSTRCCAGYAAVVYLKEKLH